MQYVYSMYNYADDNTLLNTDHRIDSLVANLENNAMVATHWFAMNGLKSNQSNFQAMILKNILVRTTCHWMVTVGLLPLNHVFNYWVY